MITRVRSDKIVTLLAMHSDSYFFLVEAIEKGMVEVAKYDAGSSLFMLLKRTLSRHLTTFR